MADPKKLDNDPFIQRVVSDAEQIVAAESPAFHSETVAVYPGEKNNLPYDVVVERLHIEEPESPTPVPEQEKTFEEVLDEHPVSIQVNGRWQTFPNANAAEEASYEEYKANLRRKHRTSVLPMSIWAKVVRKPSSRQMSMPFVC